MAGVKKIAREINKAKNEFKTWLNERNGERVHEYKSTDKEWDYYCTIDGFIDDQLYMVAFTIFYGRIRIEYKDPSVDCTFDNVDEFLQLIR